MPLTCLITTRQHDASWVCVSWVCVSWVCVSWVCVSWARGCVSRGCVSRGSVSRGCVPARCQLFFLSPIDCFFPSLIPMPCYLGGHWFQAFQTVFYAWGLWPMLLNYSVLYFQLVTHLHIGSYQCAPLLPNMHHYFFYIKNLVLVFFLRNIKNVFFLFKACISRVLTGTGT